MLIPWLSLLDFRTFGANFKKPLNILQSEKQCGDFAVLVPIFNDIEKLTNIEFLKHYGRKVVLCTTREENENFCNQLKALSDKYGFRIVFSRLNAGRKNPWAIYHKILTARETVLRDSLDNLKEKYVIFLGVRT